MTKFRNLLLLVCGIPVFIILMWVFAIPNNLIQDKIENSISRSGKVEVSASIKSLRKGPFFTLYADRLEFKINKTSALIITDISGRINPLYLFKKQFAFSIRGKIGTGNIEGFFKLPVVPTSRDRFRENGSLKIEGAEINSIPYLRSVGFEGNGLILAQLNLKNNTIDIIFKISEADISGTAMGMPLPLNSFNKIQGALYIQGNTIKITSISLEGDKGYARLKGDVINEIKNLNLELMPDMNKLNAVESILIGKYQISPGYYVIPIK